MKRSLFYLAILVAMAISEVVTVSHAAAGQAKTSSRGSIRGRVVSNDGQPLVNVGIFARAMGSQPGPGRVTSTDEKGEFLIDDLAPGLYSVNVNAPGFVDAESPPRPRYHRVGDTVSITLVRGGVITGAVTSMEGEPVVAVSVRALQVRDSDGRRLRTPRGRRAAQTDDRGIYRIYGLPAGSYIVMAGGLASPFTQVSAYTEDAPTYFPSATRDTATEITLHAGNEVTGIDIRYRGDRGYAISGTVSGALPTARTGSVSISLVNARTGAMEAGTFIPLAERNRSFAFYGVPDGEYEVFARSYSGTEGSAVSPARHVSVKGSDVTGVELSLSPLGSISGRVVVEQQADPSIKEACKSHRATIVAEYLFSAIRDEKTGDRQPSDSLTPSVLPVTPDDNGDFVAQGVDAGKYRLSAIELGDAWYVRSITLGSANRNSPPADVSLNGLSVKSGEKVTGLTISIAEGAAAIEGLVVPPAESKQLPQPLRVVLVPSEAEHKDSLLRYAEVAVAPNGAFKLRNIPPGRYWLIARKGEETEMADAPFRPSIWDAQMRAAIRAEAERADVAVELKPCQKLTDFSLRFTAPLKRQGDR